jgi:hypothetical protein
MFFDEDMTGVNSGKLTGNCGKLNHSFSQFIDIMQKTIGRIWL